MTKRILAPKPFFLKRCAFALLLLIAQGVTGILRALNRIFTKIGIFQEHRSWYRKFYNVLKSGDIKDMKNFLAQHAKSATIPNYLFSELLSLPQLNEHLLEILKGANICLEKDGGFFCKRWRAYAGSFRRTSSHNFQKDHCYAIGHFLFWLDLEGNTRFQFEKSIFKGFFDSIDHLIDYIRYRRDNEQQGVVGTSRFTEEYCLRVLINPKISLQQSID